MRIAVMHPFTAVPARVQLPGSSVFGSIPVTWQHQILTAKTVVTEETPRIELIRRTFVGTAGALVVTAALLSLQPTTQASRS